ncbi:MAG TPA: hypothetical protein VFD31_03865 [Thermoleophilaceae bacterium]|nr:hypothetical protein [Thermoleophilaceae bacterium]
MSDDPGLLGNLPRSRPGTRSDKRASGSAPKPAPAAAKPKPRPTAKPRPGAKVSNPKPRPAPETQPGDPVSEALKAAARIASAGARTANGVTREILRRLPRP